MKKPLIFLTIMLFTANLTFSSYIEIGTGTSSNYYVPFYGWSDYGWSRVIYLQSEIGYAIDITKISYNVSNTPNSYETLDQRIYMKHTSDATFASGDYEDVSTYTQVYSGTITWDGTGWFDITLDTPFSYNGTDNLVIYYQDHNGTYAGGYPRWYYTDQTNRAVYKYAPSSFPTSSGTLTNRAVNIRLHYTQPGPGEPTNPNPTNGATNIAINNNPDISWTNPVGTVYNEVYFSTVEADVINKVAGARVLNGSQGTVFSSYNQASDLLNNTWYYWRVCETDGTGTTNGLVWSFKTVCAAIASFPWTEGFEDVIPPDCWIEVRTPSSMYGWSSHATGYTGKCALFNSYSNSYGNISELITNTLDLSSLSTAQLKFVFKNPTGGDFSVLLSTDGGATYPNTILSGLTGQTNWLEKIAFITTHIGSNVKIAFKGTSNYGYDDAFVYLDDVTVEEIPPCPAPSDQTESNITSSGADLGWTENGSATYWDVYIIGTGGAAPNAGTTPTINNTTNNPLTWSGGNANTTYDWYVRSDCAACGGTGQSTWTGPITFITQCVTVTSFPYTEGFEDDWVGNPAAPSCWLVVDNNGDGDEWYQNTSSTYAHTGTKSATVYTYYNSSNDDWLITPAIDLSGTTDYRLKYWTRARSSYYHDELQILLSTTNRDLTSFTNTLMASTPIDFTTYTEDTISLAAYSSTVYIAFVRNQAPAGGHYLYLDDVTIEGIFAKDISVNSASIALPANVWCYYQGGSYTVSAVIENKGMEADPASVTLTYKEGSEPANENDGTKQVFTPAWAKGNTATCTFTTQWSPSGTGDKTVYVKSFYPGDGYTANDLASKTVNVKDQYTLLYESFEDTWNSSNPWGPPNWSEATDAAGTTVGNSDWDRKTTYVVEGSHSAYVSFFFCSTDDDWLISPVVDLTANTSKGASQLSYFICFNTSLASGDYIYVDISLDGGTSWEATHLKTYDNTNTSGMTSQTWQEIDLSAYSAQSNVKIGFYGNSNSNGNCYIFMDVVKIAPESAPGAAINPDPAHETTNVEIITDLTWSNGGGANSYNVYFGTDNPPSNIVNGTNQSGTTYDPVSDLAYATLHYWRIDAINALGTTAGNIWSFTTEADPVLTPPFTEDFSSWYPANWSKAQGLLAAPVTFTSTTLSYWDADGFANVGTTGAAKCNVYSTNRKDWMITPPINLGTTANYQLEFDLALTDWNSTDPPTSVGDDDKFAVIISTDNGITWTSANALQIWDNTTTPSFANISTTGQPITIDLTGYTNLVKLGFYAESTVSNAVNDLFVDNVTVQEVPATTSWTGATDNNWNNANNWNNGVPEADTDVTIPAGVPNYPVIDITTNAVCNKLTLEPGATITVNGNLITGD